MWVVEGEEGDKVFIEEPPEEDEEDEDVTSLHLPYGRSVPPTTHPPKTLLRGHGTPPQFLILVQSLFAINTDFLKT